MNAPKQPVAALTDQAIMLTTEDLEKLEVGLDVPIGFLNSLRMEGDWSFVIKSHALLEAAVTTLIVEHFGHPELVEIIEYLETSNNRIGKVAFLSNQNLLTKKQITFIKKFSELRNSLVHKVANVSFDFGDYLATMNAAKVKATAQWVIYYPVTIEVNGKEISKVQVMKESPKMMIWMALCEVLSRVHIRLKLLHKAKA